LTAKFPKLILTPLKRRQKAKQKTAPREDLSLASISLAILNCWPQRRLRDAPLEDAMEGTDDP